jgi:hypothetical protein
MEMELDRFGRRDENCERELEIEIDWDIELDRDRDI